jgi:hypothetical protein
MNELKSFPVDLADPAGISEKLPEARQRLEAAQAELLAKETEVAYWARAVGIMEALTSEKTDVSPLSDLQTLVVAVVNREVRKIRPQEVAQILQKEGHDVSGDSVSNSLWYAAEKLDPKPIQRVGRGFYAPLAYQEDDVTSPLLTATGIGVGALAARALLKSV